MAMKVRITGGQICSTLYTTRAHDRSTTQKKETQFRLLVGLDYISAKISCLKAIILMFIHIRGGLFYSESNSNLGTN